MAAARAMLSVTRLAARRAAAPRALALPAGWAASAASAGRRAASTAAPFGNEVQLELLSGADAGAWRGAPGGGPHLLPWAAGGGRPR